MGLQNYNDIMDRVIKVKVNSILDISEDKRTLVDELELVEPFSKWEPIKKMCNSIIDGKRTGGRLSVLDLSNSKFIQGRMYKNPDLQDCITLRHIIFPSDVHFGSFEGGLSFSGCRSLESINVSKGPIDTFGKAYDIDGVLFWNDSSNVTSLIKFPANKGTEYKIPEGTKFISKCAFEDSQLTRLIMPQVPPSCYEDSFAGVNLSALTIFVPKDSYGSYWLHPVFGKFNIKELDE